MTDTKEKPNIEERYTSATHAQRLVVTAEKSGPADVLIAAGWSPSRLGAALLRLHSEHDGAERPRMPSAEIIAAVSVKMAMAAGRYQPTNADRKAAQEEAFKWYTQEHKLWLGKLKTLPAVREQLTAWAQRQELPNPDGLTSATLFWWLSPTCTTCHGQRWQVIPGTPALSERVCPACRGSGERPMPFGLEGKTMLSYMDDAMAAARVSMRKRLRVNMEV